MITSQKEKLKEYNRNLLKYIEDNNNLVDTLYIDLGVKKVRLLCYSKEFIPLIKNQLDYSLCDIPERYDATILLWQENEPKGILKHLSDDFNPKINLNFRVKMLVLKEAILNLTVFDNDFSVSKPILSVDTTKNVINSYDRENETYFYGVKNLEPNEFIKEGHIFVQIFNNILKTPTTNLVHGACIGLDNQGILLCARGQRGKSTLSVLSMLEGFDYVSDDYLTLEKSDNDLFAYPIYSIITLSPEMYNKFSDKLNGSKYLCDNARRDKFVLNISNFHNSFQKKYPIKLCMFPEFTSKIEPSVKECTEKEKGRAITQLVHSTILQMNDFNDIKTIQKLICMLKYFRFYKIYLCKDIFKNIECLKIFMKENGNAKLQLK